MRRFGSSAAAALALAALLAGGCAAPSRLYVNPQADLTFYKKIAVLPFTNLSQQAFAGERVTRAFTTEIIMTNQFQVVEQGEFQVALDKIGGSPNVEGKYDPDKLKEACTQVQATGLLRGAVTEYQLQRSGQEEVPVLSFDAELMDVATGNIVWRVSISRRGKGRLPIVGGGASRSFGALTQQACEAAVAKLHGKVL